jgi:hypothetical protein
LQLSAVLLIASAGYEHRRRRLGSLGTLVLAGLSYREGIEAFEKAWAGNIACTCEAEREHMVTQTRGL